MFAARNFASNFSKEYKVAELLQGEAFFEVPLSQGQPLEVLAELRRYYPGWIVNANSKLGNVAITGNYRLDNPLDVLRSLAHITSAQLHELPALVVLN